MKFRVLSEAENEYTESLLWYLEEKQSPQAARRFEIEVERVYRDIQESPSRYQERPDGVRTWPLKKYPFSILYRLRDDEIVITSVHHQERSDEHWKDRN